MAGFALSAMCRLETRAEVVLPENASYMGTEAEKRRLAEPIDGPTWRRFGDKAKQHGIWLVAGTMPETSSTGRPYNTSVLFDPEGKRAAVYRKIHLFDIALGAGATHMESEHVEPGTSATLATTSLGNTDSIRLLEKLGFRFERVLRVPGYNDDSRYFSIDAPK